MKNNTCIFNKMEAFSVALAVVTLMVVIVTLPIWL